MATSLSSHTGTDSGSQPRVGAAGGRWLTFGALGVTLILWAAAFTGIRVALDGYTPTQLAALRYLIASIVLLIYALITRMPLPRLRDVPGIALCGFVGFSVYNITLNAGEQTVPAAVASFLISSEVGGIAVLGWLLLRERLPLIGWIGVALCIIGVGIISFGDSGETSGFVISAGVLLLMVATLSISFYSILQKPYLERYSAIAFTAYAIWAGAFFLMLAAPDTFGALAANGLTSAPTLAVVFLAIFPGVIAYVCWSYVLSKIPAARAGSYLATIPLAALVIAWVWLGEVPPPIALVGGAVVLGGVMLVNRQESAKT